MQKFGKPRDINTKTRTYAHSPSWNTQAHKLPLLLHSARLLALAPALSLASIRTYTATFSFFGRGGGLFLFGLPGAHLQTAEAQLLGSRGRLTVAGLCFGPGWEGGREGGGDGSAGRGGEVRSRRFCSSERQPAQQIPRSPCLACPPSFVCLVFSL